MNIRRWLLILVIPTLISMWLLGCSVSDNYMPEDKYNELQQEQKKLQSELTQLKEQERSEILEEAQAYNAIIQFLSEQDSVEIKALRNMSAEDIASGLQADAKLCNLIKSTEDAELISACQPQGEWPQVRCSCSYLEDYAEEKYSKLMAEYNSK